MRIKKFILALIFPFISLLGCFGYYMLHLKAYFYESAYNIESMICIMLTLCSVKSILLIKKHYYEWDSINIFTKQLCVLVICTVLCVLSWVVFDYVVTGSVYILPLFLPVLLTVISDIFYLRNNKKIIGIILILSNPVMVYSAFMITLLYRILIIQL